MLLTAWENEQALVEKKEKEVSGRGRGHTRAAAPPRPPRTTAARSGEPGPARFLATTASLGVPGGRH